MSQFVTSIIYDIYRYQTKIQLFYKTQDTDLVKFRTISFYHYLIIHLSRVKKLNQQEIENQWKTMKENENGQILNDRDYHRVFQEENRRRQQQIAEAYNKQIQDQKIMAMGNVQTFRVINIQQKLGEIEEQRQRITEAQKSLEQEKLSKQQKLNNYRSSLDQCLQQKQTKEDHSRRISLEITKQDLNNMQWYSEKEMLNMADYRNKFVRKDAIMAKRQNDYQQQVMSPAMHKTYQINQVIDNGVEEYNKMLEIQERNRKERKLAMSMDRLTSLERQMQEKRQQRQAIQEEQQREVNERMKLEQDYKDWVKGRKLQKREQQGEYKNVLESQISQMTMKNENDNSKKFSLEKSSDDIAIGIIPGQIENRYRKASNHIYYTDGRPSPRGTNDSNNLNQSMQINDARQTLEFYRYSQLQFDTPISLKNSPDKQDPFKRSYNSNNNSRANSKLNSSLQDAAIMQLNMFNPKGQINYNPIINPIPSVNQNPYITKGRIDFIGQTKVRGKIQHKQEQNF